MLSDIVSAVYHVCDTISEIQETNMFDKYYKSTDWVYESI